MRVLLLLWLAMVLVGCQPEAQAVPWRTTATFLRDNVGQRFAYLCPAGTLPEAVWGTDVYTDDSSICSAAVHAGKVSFEKGGLVTLEVRPDPGSYAGSLRNGVTSSSFGSWRNAFVFVE